MASNQNHPTKDKKADTVLGSFLRTNQKIFRPQISQKEKNKI